MSRVAFLFPGQGSQHPGMGRDLPEHFAASRAVFETADSKLGRELSRTCFEGDKRQLAMTETTQPAILTVSIAALRALDGSGVRPAAAAGHSLGEYSALVAAGTLEFGDAVRTVRLRGRFMQEAVPAGVGAMAAILGLDPPTVEELCRQAAQGQVVSPANLNGPGQVVIAGHREAVDRAVAGARQAGAKRALPLPVSAPFHCALMQPAATRLATVLAEIPMGDPSIPVYTNVDAAPVRSGDAAREALVRQVASPVRWGELIEAMVSDGVDTFVEIGPGRVLTGLVRRIHPAARLLNVFDADSAGVAAQELGSG